MPSFLKNPKFIAGAIVVLWLAWVIYENFQLNAVSLSLLPVFSLHIQLSSVIVGSAILGCVLTLLIQWFWRRRSSKNASQSPVASGARSSTVA